MPAKEELRLPSWLRPSIGNASEISEVQKIIKQRGIHTICEEGRCPNRAECYSQKTATFQHPSHGLSQQRLFRTPAMAYLAMAIATYLRRPLPPPPPAIT